MKVGVRAHDYGKYDAGTLAARLAGDGFEAAQLALPKAIEGINCYESIAPQTLAEIREAFETKEIEISVVGCYIDLSNPDEEVYRKQEKEFICALHACKALGAGMVGTESSYGVVPMEDKERGWPILEERVKRLSDAAERVGVTVGIEPVAAHTLYCPEWTEKLLKNVGSARLKVIFDPVNLLTPVRVSDQEELWQSCFGLFGQEIAVVHLKDFIMGENGIFSPCCLGEGQMRYGAIFDWLREHKSGISILREELCPATAGKDLAFMRKLIGQA